MASEYDYETSLTFRKTEKFWVELNKAMVIKDRDTLNDYKYHLVFFSKIPLEFNECIDEYGCLLPVGQRPSTMVQITSGYTDVEFHLGVKWLDNGENGFDIFLDEWDDNTNSLEHEIVDVNIEIDEDVELMIKGVALCKTYATDDPTKEDYVVAYARPSTEFKAFNYITIMGGSSFVGHNSCEVA